MTIYIDDAIPEVDAAQDAESYEWLWNDSPVYARAVEAAIRNGRTPQQIRAVSYTHLTLPTKRIV